MTEPIRERVSNSEIYGAVLVMQRQFNDFTSADGWGGRVLALEKESAENCKDITSLQHEVLGNGKPGVKKELIEVKMDLLEVKHDVKTTLAIVRWVMTPIFVGLVGVIIKLLFL